MPQQSIIIDAASMRYINQEIGRTSNCVDGEIASSVVSGLSDADWSASLGSTGDALEEEMPLHDSEPIVNTVPGHLRRRPRSSCSDLLSLDSHDLAGCRRTHRWERMRNATRKDHCPSSVVRATSPCKNINVVDAKDNVTAKPDLIASATIIRAPRRQSTTNCAA